MQQLVVEDSKSHGPAKQHEVPTVRDDHFLLPSCFRNEATGRTLIRRKALQSAEQSSMLRKSPDS